MPSTFVRRSATGSENERMIETWPASGRRRPAPGEYRLDFGGADDVRTAYDAPEATFSRRPLNSLSTTETSCPSQAADGRGGSR